MSIGRMWGKEIIYAEAWIQSRSRLEGCLTSLETLEAWSPPHHTHLSSSARARSFSGPVLKVDPGELPLLCPCWRVIQFILHPHPLAHISASSSKYTLRGPQAG